MSTARVAPSASPRIQSGDIFRGPPPWAGVVRAVMFTFLILGCTALLTRMKIRMQL